MAVYVIAYQGSEDHQNDGIVGVFSSVDKIKAAFPDHNIEWFEDKPITSDGIQFMVGSYDLNDVVGWRVIKTELDTPSDEHWG